MEINKLTKIVNDGDIIEILEYNPDRCLIVLLGKLPNKENYIIKIHKKEFNIDEIQIKSNLIKILTNPEEVFNNDIYYKYISNDYQSNQNKIDLVYPADLKVIDKYRRKGSILYCETSEIYKSKTLKYIENIDPKNTEWIDNILYKGTEKILFSLENNFVIAQDYNTKDNENLLNCLGIPYNKNIKSLRDLNESHIELLENFYYTGRRNLSKLYNIEENKIRCFIHYPPSFYYFHVHYLNIEYESSSISINRAIDLYTIIQNIKLKSKYYEDIDIEINLQIGSKLYNILTNN